VFFLLTKRVFYDIITMLKNVSFENIGKDFIKSELLVLIPVLYVVGIGLKKSKLSDTLMRRAHSARWRRI